ncbi:DUF6552 family protein [Oceanibacterium hippocampi]|uniref:Ubiquinone biosynthesis methyltransferase UbiE n=1 Tax=Oceanibacterium hippocampi TaxID=745714 RepID=A0A1Y5RWG1_9PROT|nr:DUF6552 family protein [Oceanibacterium hippocampi]SLN26654.1 hypothetical protein OCH7691_00839 [Oceanibacterium hippocampi]
MPSDAIVGLRGTGRIAFAIKWIASAMQILGYSATAVGLAPWNIYLFLAGLTGWLAVGVLWNDKAIMLIHLAALGAMLVGLAGGS